MEEKILNWAEYLSTARQAAAEGCVLLKNENNVLPFNNGCRVSVFGRAQNHYYKSGTGSGGMVNVSRVTDIMTALRESSEVSINEELAEIYREWEEKNPPEKTKGWGQEPFSQAEMPLSEDIVEEAGKVSDAALVIIGRSSGEDYDFADKPGAFRLSEAERGMIKNVSEVFPRMAVVLNTGSIINMDFDTKVPAVMYVWQGGMIGGYGAADVITGKVSPSGKLTDTISYEIYNYPAHAHFGDEEKNLFEEDIYVGYRYFSTFNPDHMRYPFGFGLSYTTFEISAAGYFYTRPYADGKVNAYVSVTNTGNVPGKEVVQVYINAPQGVLGRPLRALIAYKKTKLLEPGQSELIRFEIDNSVFAAYDSSGKTGFRSAYVLEKGTYEVYIGNNVRDAVKSAQFEISENLLIEQLEEAMAPVEEFDILKPMSENGKITGTYSEKAPVMTVDEKQRIIDDLPADIPFTGDKGIKLGDVLSGKNSMEEFIAQLSDEDLACIVRGEGMSSPLVTPGTAAAFGGVTESLRNFGIPAACCDDGPSGLRLDCGNKAFSLPIGTMLACTFNDELVEKLFSYTGLELAANKVEALLGPGMNIHRYPLNGRNFEYFSEDPLVTGKMAAAELRGLHSAGVTGVIKHFCANVQEHNRYSVNNVISERALREIYLKGFEIAVKEGGADSVMTTYGPVNGLWTAGNYDLVTVILRKEWGFTGIAMTDWWATVNSRGEEPSRTNFAAMVRAQNDIYMVVPCSANNSHGDNTAASLADGSLTRGELCRSAANICRFAMNSLAMKRLSGTACDVKIINRPAEDEGFDLSDAVSAKVDGSAEFDLTYKVSGVGMSFSYLLELSKAGKYKVTVTGSSDLGELAQIPCTFFISGKPVTVFVFNGTGGKDISIEKTVEIEKTSEAVMLYVGQLGANLKKMKLEYVS